MFPENNRDGQINNSKKFKRVKPYVILPPSQVPCSWFYHIEHPVANAIPSFNLHTSYNMEISAFYV